MSGQWSKASRVCSRTVESPRGADSLSKPMRWEEPPATMMAVFTVWLGQFGLDGLGEGFSVGAALGFLLKEFHDFTHVGAGGGSGFGNGLGDGGFDFFGGERGGEVFFEDGDFCLFLFGEFGATGLFELGDGVLALFDLFPDDAGDFGFVESGVGPAFFDGRVFDGGFEGAQGAEGEGVLGSHCGFEVFGDLFS